MTFKVPFLSDAQLESAAQELLRRYAKWKGEPPRPPIPVDAEPTLTAAQLAARLRARAGGKTCETQSFADAKSAIEKWPESMKRLRETQLQSRAYVREGKHLEPSPQPATAGDVERWHASTATHTDEAHVEVIARLVPALRKKIEDRERGDNFSDVFPTWQVTALLDEINRLRALVRP